MLWKCIEEGPKFKNFPRKVKEQERGEKEKKEKEGKWMNEEQVLFAESF